MKDDDEKDYQILKNLSYIRASIKAAKKKKKKKKGKK